jgi:cytochrome c-type biogenesis protein CcmE
MLGKKKFIIGAVVVAVAIGLLAWSAFGDGATYYLTTSELAAKGEDAVGQSVRVAGGIAPGTIEIEQSSRTLRFDVQDEGGQFPVVYKGTVPDTFQEGNDVVVEGKLGKDGVFEAKTIVVKCPSKYEPE